MNTNNEASMALAKQGMETINSLAEGNFNILLFGVLGFAIISIIKLIIFIKNKKRFKNSLTNILILSIPYALINSITLVFSMLYGTGFNFTIMIFTIMLIPIALIGLIYIYYDNIINVVKTFIKSLTTRFRVSKNTNNISTENIDNEM